MKTHSYIKLIKKGRISDETELERAFVIERKLRLMEKDNPELNESRQIIRSMISNYENNNWNSTSVISDNKIKESDNAELIVENERQFLSNRKQLIKERIAEIGLNQQDLGVILGHSKTYMSELMNGISPFAIKDLIIIHKLFKITLENLVPTTISQNDSIRINTSISKLDKPIMAFV